MQRPKKRPTPEQCSNHAKVLETETKVGYAIWYPQMGGYSGQAIVVFDKHDSGGCFDTYIWHDGEFPFGDDEQPHLLHHCDADQFVSFGKAVSSLMNQGNNQ